MVKKMKFNILKPTYWEGSLKVVKGVVDIGLELAPVVLIAPVFHQSFEIGMSYLKVIPLHLGHALIQPSVLQFYLDLL